MTFSKNASDPFNLSLEFVPFSISSNKINSVSLFFSLSIIFLSFFSSAKKYDSFFNKESDVFKFATSCAG